MADQIGVKTYINFDWRVIFEYPSKWYTVKHYKKIYGVDALLFREYTNLGITEISEEELKIQENNTLMNFWWSRYNARKKDKNDITIHGNGSFYNYQPNHNYLYNPLVLALKSCTQKDEIIIQDVIPNKHKIGYRNNKYQTYSASMLPSIQDKRSGQNLFHERTLLIQENDQQKNKNKPSLFEDIS